MRRRGTAGPWLTAEPQDLVFNVNSGAENAPEVPRVQTTARTPAPARLRGREAAVHGDGDTEDR